ncbi:MAG TPA: hypothetical protein EYG85_08660 [Crocinitomix sp.]|nr:hypothetical protein [Crocinitomix sp.]
MKKLFVLSIIGLTIFTLQSCKKSYACECEGKETELNYGKVAKDEVDALKTACESDTTITCVFTQK